MKRFHEVDVNTPGYFDRQWAKAVKTGRNYDRVRLRALMRYVKATHAVADVGCGLWGALECLLVDHPERRPERVIFCDYSRYALDNLRERFPYAEFYDSVEALPRVDVIVSGEVIEHTQDPKAFAADLVGRCGEHVAVSTVDHACDGAQVRNYREHLWKFSGKGLTECFEPVCSRVEYESVGDYHIVWAWK